MTQPSCGGTMLDVLVQRLRDCAASTGGVAAPAAILWTDPSRQWAPLRPVLLARVPELLVLGEFDQDSRTGPAIWARCVVERTLDNPALPADRTPIVLLPGIGRQHLRAGPECPPAVQPLVELMYRGSLWLHPGGHDWTVPAFLTSPQGLALDVAKDDRTREALARALPELAVTPLAQLRGHRLEAEDFDRLLSSDVVRDVLRWMSDPAETRARLGENAWGAFRSQCRERLAFDPGTQADVTAGARLGTREAPWGEVWERFAEAPGSYPGVEPLLRRSRVAGPALFDQEPWPDLNDSRETEVREALKKLPERSHDAACDLVESLEAQHGKRRGWVWARIGRCPMAAVLEPLTRLAAAVRSVVGGASPDDIAAEYVERGWQADAAAWEAVAAAQAADEEVVGAAVRHLLLPWAESSAQAFQAALERGALPGPGEQLRVEAGADGCILFSDGLRYDLGQRLAERLEARGMRVTVRHRWAAAPTVTATGKPAVSAVADLVRGEALGEDFGVLLAPNGVPANAQNLRAAMEQRGYQILGTGGFDAPMSAPAKGWLETGDIDALGHQRGSRLARHIGEELERLVQRIAGLLDCGWKQVRVVTDHGWLLVPGGLPKVDLPKHLTASRWARCAVISGDSQPDAPRHPWSWNPLLSFAYARGVACFNKTEEYAHGGLSIQECLTPDIVVERAQDQGVRASIASVTWRGLRCFVEVKATAPGIRADLRLADAAGESVVVTAKPVEADGAVSLVLSGDEHEEAGLVLVLLDESGQVLAQRPTRVGATS